MDPKLLKILPEVRRPSRYLGNEKNAVKKDLSQVELKVALSYPDTYEIGMSNIGLSILYHLLNDQPHIACERVYSPWIDMEQKMREHEIPLMTLESSLPVRECDIFGISIPYELTFTNILTLLDLAKIPFLSKDRDESFPLILGGGTGAFNPEPVADFFDAIVVGDGEDIFLEICETVRESKGCSKKELLQKLSKIKGIYIPSFFEPIYKDDGTLLEIKPLLEGYPGVEKRSVADLNASYFPKKPIVPHTKVIHDRIGVEVQRGCTRGCRFCQAGYIYRPERQRSPETVKQIVRDQIKATGLEEVSLISLSIGDYDCVSPLLKDIIDEHSAKKVNVSLPATRVEQLTDAMMQEVKRVRKSGFTIAPEAATERMRLVINKGNTEENLLKTVEGVFSNGWSLMKFYFMIGLPTERDEDVIAIGTLGNKCLQIGLKHNRRAEINLGVSPFVPKPFTPYQWCGQIPLAVCHEKLDLLRSQIKSKRLHLKPHKPETTYLEGIFSRGDRRLSKLLLLAWEKGCRFDEWDEGLKYHLWTEAWTELGIDPTFYVERERPRDEVFPWDHLFIQMKKDWLWDDYQESLKDVTPGFIDDCSTGACTTCGVCDYQEVRNRSYESPIFNDVGRAVKKKTTTEVRLYQINPLEKLDPNFKTIIEPRQSVATYVPPDSSIDESQSPEWVYECTFDKTGIGSFLSHLEFVDSLRRVVSRADLPVKYTLGFHPFPKISFGQGMAVGRDALDQKFKISFSEPMDPREIQERLQKELPEGFVMKDVVESRVFNQPKAIVALASSTEATSLPIS